MPYTAPTVNYATTMDGTYTTLTGVLSVTFNRGRQRFMDPFPPTSCQIELIPANSYATPLAIGQFIDVRQTNSSGSEAYFVGQITDVTRAYDMPYNAGTGAAPGDRIVITALGPTGLCGRALFNNVEVLVVAEPAAARTLFTQNTQRYLNIKSDALVNFTYLKPIQQFFTSDTPLDVLNQIAATDPFYFSDRDNARTVTGNPSGNASYNPGYGPLDFAMTIVGQRDESANAFTFSDTGSGYEFNRIEYGTGAQNSFTQVNVVTENADGYTNVAVQSAYTGFSPFSALNWNTYGTTAAEASSLASYILTRSYVPTAAPMSVSTTTVVDDTITTLAKMNTVIPGQRGAVTFRGTTYRVTLEGLDVAFFADRAVVTAHFSPFPLDYFILDSSTNGVLDTNRLGF
jgi:hypothetical protein